MKQNGIDSLWSKGSQSMNGLRKTVKWYFTRYSKIHLRWIKDLNKKIKLATRRKYGFKKYLGISRSKIDTKSRPQKKVDEFLSITIVKITYLKM